MRILILHQWLVVGGIERVLLSYLPIFKRLNYNVSILLTYNLAYKEKSLQKSLPNDINVDYIFSEEESKKILNLKENKKLSLIHKLRYEYNRLIINYKISSAIKRKIQSSNFDLIIDFSCILEPQLNKSFIANVNIPIIRWNHSQLSKHKSNDKHYKILSKYTKIITISKEMENILHQDIRLPKHKLETIYNPIDIEDILYKSKQKPSISLDDKYFIVVSRLVHGKGLLELIDIYNLLRKKGVTHKLYIIGDGECKQEIYKRIIEYKLEDFCILLGEITNPYPYLSNSTLFLFTSEKEGLPTVLLESITCGIPIIAMDCPTGPKEIIGENNEYGKLIPLHDKDRFIQAVLELIERPNLYQYYIEQSNKRSLHFSSKNIENNVKESFTKIVEKYYEK